MMADAIALHALQIVIALRMMEREAAGARSVEAGQAVEDRRLAGTVRADDRGDLARARGERDVVDGDEAAEAHGQMLDRQERRASLGRHRVRLPAPARFVRRS